MYLIDSNIIIYASLPENDFLRQFISDNVPSVSAVSYVEVLGYHRLSAIEQLHLEAFFAATTIHSLTKDILDQAVKLRQQRKMTLGDAFIAATCLVHNLTLVTRNVSDFQWITGLGIYNPFDTVT